MKSCVLSTLLLTALPGAMAAPTDKTLVSWVALANTTQQGGSALTIQSGERFDAIVFGERAAGKWMAGSEFYSRTQAAQEANALEKAAAGVVVQIAIVYRGRTISVFRDGMPYSAHEADNIDLLGAADPIVVFGLRHVGAGSGQTLQGAVEDARIYDRALAADEIKELKPDHESDLKPIAWWTFEDGKQGDRTGRFAFQELTGGARIEGGRLVLDRPGATLIAATRKTPGGLGQNETPSPPARPPAAWPAFHLFHPGPGGAMPGDPNCAFFWKGLYHLHYIYNHRAGFAFAHVSSKDLVHWKWHPTTLTPLFTGHGMFSGTGFLTKDGKPAIIYHGQGSGRNQIAFALDDQLEQWTKPVPVVPKDAAGKEAQFNNWDPDCWLDGETYYALSGGANPSLMKSSDLREWRFLGSLLHDALPAGLGIPRGEDISCANMFRIGGKWMLLCISHPLGCRYYLGDFKDGKYLPDFHAMMSWNGNHYFAPESVLTADGRRVMWAWLMNLPLGAQGVQSLPRELELPADGILRIRPLRELATLRRDPRDSGAMTLKDGVPRLLEGVDGQALELEVTFRAPLAAESGIDVLCGPHGEGGLRLALVPAAKVLRAGGVNAPFEAKPGEDVTLRVFVDKNLVEIFANDRQAAVTARPHDPAARGVALFAKGGDATVTRVRSWRMESTLPTSP